MGIWRGSLFKANELFTEPLDTFTEYWSKRLGYKIGDLVLSSTGLVFFFFSFLSWTLLKG